MGSIRLAVFAYALAVGASASAQDRPQRLHPLSPAADVVAFAVENGCLPFLSEGGSIHDRLRESARGGELNGRPADRLIGRGDVHIQQLERGGCYIIARRADATELRRSVLDALTRAGSPPTALQDSGETSRDSNGQFRQESGCFMIAGKVGAYVISTSTDGSHAPLQASLIVDTDGRCAEIAASGQTFAAFVAQRREEAIKGRLDRFGAIVAACRAIIGGTPVEDAARAADVRLGAPRALPNTGRFAEAGAASFFAGDASVRASRVARGESPVWLFASQSGARCQVASGGPASTVDAMARSIANADAAAPAQGVSRTERGDTIRIQIIPQPEGMALVSVFMTRAAEEAR